MPSQAAVASKRWPGPLSVTMLAPQAGGLDDALQSTIFQGLLWSYSLVVMLSSFAVGVNTFDDVIPLVGGMLVEQGRTPNLDFYSFYPPLSLYMNAGVFHLLGRSVLAVRLFSSVLYVLVLLLAMRFFQFRFPDSRSLTRLALLLLGVGMGLVLAMPVWPGFAVALIALLTYLCTLYLGRYRLLVVAASGILTGLALLYRVNFGGYVVMVVLMDLALHWWRGGKEERFPGSRLAADLVTGLVFIGCLTVCCLVLLVSIFGKHAGTAIFQFVVTAQRLMTSRGFIDLRSGTLCAILVPPAWFLFRVLKGTNVIPAKAVVPVALAVIPLGVFHFGHSHVQMAWILPAFALATVVLLHVFIRRLERSELLALLFFCGLSHYVLSRGDLPHLRILPTGLALLIPFLVLAERDPQKSAGQSAVPERTALAMLLAAFAAAQLMNVASPTAGHVLTGVRLMASLVRHPHATDTFHLLNVDRPAAPWQSVYGAPNELLALRYLRAHTRSTDPIFVGEPDHSRLFQNNLRFYWLADRPIGVRAFQLETRTATEANAQREIISDLERNDVNWVVIYYDSPRGDLTFRAQNYVGAKLLDDYIASRYREQARFGPYAVLSRTKPPPPTDPVGYTN